MQLCIKFSVYFRISSKVLDIIAYYITYGSAHFGVLYYGGNMPLLIKGRFYVDVFFVYKGKILPQCLLCVLNGKILYRVSDVKPNACNCIVCAY